MESAEHSLQRKDGGAPKSEGEDLRARLRDLIPGEETVLWAGQPDFSRAFRQGVTTSVFSLLILGIFVGVSGGFVGRWPGAESPRRHFDDDGLSVVFRTVDRIIPVLFGGFALAAPHLAVRSARRTLYAVTPLRLLIVQLGRSPAVQSFLVSELPFLECREQKGGTGDLIFSKREESDSEGGVRVVEIGFLGVREIRTAESVIRSLRELGPRPA